MATIQLPQQQTPGFRDFVQSIKSLDGERLADAIPRELYEPRLARGLLGFFASTALYVGAVIGVHYAPHWSLWIPLWLLAGLGGWGLFCIAHDCGHNSFSKSRRFNFALGQIALFPLLYPFHGWRHMHNLHHANTNSLEMDTDWRPVLPEQYRRMGAWEKFVYRSTRSWLFWLGTVNYQRHSGFKPSMFPKREARNDVRRSVVVTVLFAAVYLPTLVWFTGWQGFLLYFLGPWLGIHAWFSTTTMMHHISDELPFLTREHWSLNGSRLMMTTDYEYPKWLHFFTHNISVHAAHHVVPVIPFYNLPQAREALKRAYPGSIRQKPFTLGEVWKVIRACHLYDPVHGYYRSFEALATPPAATPPRADSAI
ncbi:fatty acid desaturase [Burkholderia gladioli]|uniref:fatty acid desaturase n=1 Tax=Burkholderia gladioli TaxID=28095 RepID=UPI00163F6F06|nr:fatty acid desaturase [Burkholderia gladioli]